MLNIALGLALARFGDYSENGQRFLYNQLSRPSVDQSIATDWITVGCLKWCLMYSRNYSEDLFSHTRPTAYISSFLFV